MQIRPLVLLPARWQERPTRDSTLVPLWSCRCSTTRDSAQVSPSSCGCLTANPQHAFSKVITCRLPALSSSHLAAAAAAAALPLPQQCAALAAAAGPPRARPAALGAPCALGMAWRLAAKLNWRAAGCGNARLLRVGPWLGELAGPGARATSCSKFLGGDQYCQWVDGHPCLPVRRLPATGHPHHRA